MLKRISCFEVRAIPQLIPSECSVIPLFPQFKNIELGDRNDVAAITDRFPPYSDFNFTSLWTWDTLGGRSLSLLNGNLVVRFTEYLSDSAFLSFIGDNDCDATAHALFAHSASIGVPPVLRLVPEASARRLRAYNATEDADQHDYVYSVSEWRYLSGRRNHRTKMHAQKFERENSAAVTRTIELQNRPVQTQMLDVASIWEKHKHEQNRNYQPNDELKALARLFTTNAQMSLLGTGLFLDGTMIAFSIDEVLKNHQAICHFMKADFAYKGLYQYFNRQKAHRLGALGVAYINCEQDLGLPALRAAKLAMRPTHYLKKYSVAP